jgi:mercuric ion binding protein
VRAFFLAALLSSFAPFATSQELKSATLYAEKIYCDACAAVITKALRNVPGVSKVSVDVERKEVLVQFDAAKATVEDLTAATGKRGFPSTVRKVEP